MRRSRQEKEYQKVQMLDRAAHILDEIDKGYVPFEKVEKWNEDFRNMVEEELGEEVEDDDIRF